MAAQPDFVIASSDIAVVMYPDNSAIEVRGHRPRRSETIYLVAVKRHERTRATTSRIL